MDIEDLVIKALQDYTLNLDNQLLKVGLLALSEDMAAYLIDHLGLKQTWATGWLYNDGQLSDIEDEDTHPDIVLEVLENMQERDVLDEKRYGPLNGRSVLVSRLVTDYAVVEEPKVDKELAALAASEQ